MVPGTRLIQWAVSFAQKGPAALIANLAAAKKISILGAISSVDG